MASRTRIIIALVSGALAALMLAFYASSVRAEAFAARDKALERYGGEVVQLCVTTQAIGAGESFTADNTALVSWLLDLVPEGAIQDQEKLIGKRALVARPANAVVVDGDVVELAPIQVPEGMVACSVPGAEVRSVGGALLPGQKVDIYVSGEQTKRLASQVLVLATSAAQQSGERKEGAKLQWLTLAVPPQLVEAIISSSVTQTLHFVLPSESLAVHEAQKGAGGAQVQEAIPERPNQEIPADLYVSPAASHAQPESDDSAAASPEEQESEQGATHEG